MSGQVTSAYRVREARQDDNEGILQLLADNPQPGPVNLAFERSPDYFHGASVSSFDPAVLSSNSLIRKTWWVCTTLAAVTCSSTATYKKCITPTISALIRRREAAKRFLWPMIVAAAFWRPHPGPRP